MIRLYKGCGAQSNKNISRAHGVGFDFIIDEDKVAIRLEFGDDIVVPDGGKYLTSFSTVLPEELQYSDDAQRGARILGSFAADVDEFEITTQHVPV